MSEPARRPLVEALVHNLRRASFTLQGHFREALAKQGLSMGQFAVLRTLGPTGRGTTKDLAQAMGVTTGTISGLVDKLEAEGLVQRERSKEDRRVVYLEVTKKGRSVMEEMRQAVIRDAAAAFEDWSATDLEKLNDLLGRVIKSDPEFC